MFPGGGQKSAHAEVCLHSGRAAVREVTSEVTLEVDVGLEVTLEGELVAVHNDGGVPSDGRAQTLYCRSVGIWFWLLGLIRVIWRFIFWTWD